MAGETSKNCRAIVSNVGGKLGGGRGRKEKLQIGRKVGITGGVEALLAEAIEKPDAVADVVEIVRRSLGGACIQQMTMRGPEFAKATP